MAQYSIQRFPAGCEKEWDQLVTNTDGGTIFHLRSFLQYHGSRFAAQEHHLGIYKGETLKGIMPMALIPCESGLEALSPYGASYGGPVMQDVKTVAENMAVVSEVVRYLQKQGVTKIRFTLPISPCLRHPSDTLRFAFLTNGFTCIRREISHVVPLQGPTNILSQCTAKVRNHLRKAEQQHINIRDDAPMDLFAEVLDRTWHKHGVSPTHTAEDLCTLKNILPREITARIAMKGDTPVAGILLFRVTPKVQSTFYLCQPTEYKQSQALTLLICRTLEEEQQRGTAWVDFGTSSVDMQPRDTVCRFKEGFGATGFFRESYKLDL